MGFLAKMALYWRCDRCKEEWFADSDVGPRQCPFCHSRRWNDGALLDADLYLQSLRLVYLNPHRKPLACASAPHSREPMRNEPQMRDGDAGLRVKPEG
jgi:hypothetical protein